MKKIGIIGGLGPESTLVYYKGIIEAFKADCSVKGYPEMSIESIDLWAFTALAEQGKWDAIADLIGRKCELLRASGANFGAIATNTPHKVFPQIQAQTSLPLLSIVEATCEYASVKGLRKLGLMGTRFTMESDFYHKVFEPKEITIVTPQENDRNYIHAKLYSEIEFGIVKSETKRQFISIVERLEKTHRIEGLILGCTELPLILKPEDIGISYLDTTAIHVAKIVETCRE
ncbi:MAG: amino acid racemase [Candidatus Latescibacteria bacterium]|nr:amino acid racemase [Candidatus Latescibacterota bacterium]